MIFDFQCKKCERVKTDVFIKFNHDIGDHPVCCGQPMMKAHFKAPGVHWKDYDLPEGGFKAAHDGTVIVSRKQNRDYMERNNLQDANEVYDCPTHEVQKKEIAQAQQDIDAITPTDSQMDQMKSDGTLEQIEKMMES